MVFEVAGSGLRGSSVAWLWQQYLDNSLNIAVVCATFLILSMARQRG